MLPFYTYCIAILFAAIFTSLLYQILLRPYLQYQYFLQQFVQNPNLLIDMPPRFVPFFGDLIRLSKATKQNDDCFFLAREAIKNRARFSITFMGSIPRIAILDADVVHDLLSAQMFEWNGFSRFSEMIFGLMIPESLICLEGLRWQQRRKIVVPVFRYQMMKFYGIVMAAFTRDILDNFQPPATEIDFSRVFKRWTISIIGTCAFGGVFNQTDELDRKRTEEVVQSLASMIESSSDFVTHPLNLIPDMMWFPTPARIKFRSCVKRCQAVADHVIQRRLQGQQAAIDCERDLLDVLLSYKSESGNPLSINEIRDECLLFIFAGHETTANLLTWLLVVFCQYPEIQQRCRQEVLEVLQSSNATFATESEVKTMQFLHCCLLETLRLYPPAPVLGRQTRRRYNLGGLDVPAETLLRVDIWAIHHSPRYWSNPDKFDPGRFLSTDEKGKTVVRPPADILSRAFLPFGSGIRNCPAQHLLYSKPESSWPDCWPNSMSNSLRVRNSLNESP